MSTTRKPTKAFLIRLRSKGLCFVCLRNTEEPLNRVNGFPTGAQVNPNPRTFRLRALTRFLGVNTKEVLQTFLTPELSKCDDVKVELCRECTELVKRVNELYQTLELTRLKLNDCMGKICDLIGEADKDHARVEEMRERVTHEATAGVVRGLRKKVFEKCSEKLEVETPRVVLERLTAKQLDAYQRPSAKFEENVEEEDDEQPEFDNGDPNSPLLSEPEHSITLRAVRRRQDNRSIFIRRGYLKPPIQPEDAKKEYKCPHCGSRRNLGKSGWNMRSHMVRRHCHHLLIEHKLPSISEDTFEAIVARLLFKDMMVREGDKSRCLICSKTFANFKVLQFSAMMVHLIEDHEEILQSRLMELQVEPLDFRGKLEPTPNPAIRTKKAKDSIFKRKGYLKTMMVARAAGAKKEHKCPHCGSQKSLGKGGWNMRSHMVRCHCHHLLMEHKFPSISEDTFEAIVDRLLFKDLLVREGDRSRCLICSKTFASFKTLQFSLLKLHLIEKHQNVVRSKLTELQEDPDLKMKLESTPQQKRTRRSRSRKVVQFPPDSLKKHCPHCDVVVESGTPKEASWNMEVHLVAHHLEKFFEPGDCYKDPSLNSLEFRQVLHHLLFENFLDLECSKCPWCPKSFTPGETGDGTDYIWKVHFLREHHNHLGHRLRELQQNPDLFQKLSSIPPGKLCPCGAYFQRAFTFSLHQKKWCKLGSKSNLGDTITSPEPQQPGPGNNKVEMDHHQTCLPSARYESCGQVQDHGNSCRVVEEIGEDPLALDSAVEHVSTGSFNFEDLEEFEGEELQVTPTFTVPSKAMEVGSEAAITKKRSIPGTDLTQSQEGKGEEPVQRKMSRLEHFKQLKLKVDTESEF